MEIKNLCVGRKYTNKAGEEKTQWTTIGKMFIKDDGKINIQIDCIPVAWDGRAMAFDQENKNPF